MKKYAVEIPIAGSVQVEVKVEDDASADDIFEAACEQYFEDEKTGGECITWDFHQAIAEGNVLHTDVYEWSYEEVDDGDWDE